uniref:PDZ domain-containing protein n=1 Tax=Heterorhabditis bacteriophora TaxID=37862 RepID=A0A1I7WXF4_HETBA
MAFVNSKDSLQGSTDRQGSPPYTVLRKSSHSSKASRNSKREAKTLRKYPAERSIGSKESLIRKDCELSSQARECPEVSGSGETQLARDTGKECSEQPSTSSLCTETVEYEKMPEKTEEIMNRMTSRTPSTGSESINQQVSISIVGGRVEVSQKGGLPGTGNTVSGIFIKSVLPNSPAGKSGMMNMGDRVISVNDVDLREATHEQAVAAIKHASNPVRFVLQSLHSFTPQQVNITSRKLLESQMISSASNSTVGSIRIESAKPEEIPVFKTDSPILVTVPKTIPQIVRKEESITTESSKTEDNQVNSESKEDESNRNFSPPLISPSIIERRESVQSKNSMHIDEILTKEISEKDEHRDNLSRQQSAENELGKDVVKMKDGLQKRDSMKKQDSMRSMELRKESCTSGPLIVSDVSSSETHEEEPVQKYGHLSGDILIVECDRVPEAGLGISLAGNKERNKLSVFVIAVKVACPLAIRAGDELLEVNGRVLYGKSHVTASAIVKKCCEGGGLEMLICRRDGSLDECAVRPGEPSTAIVSLTSEQSLSSTSLL